MNAIEWNRDLTRPIDEIRQREAGMTDKPDRGRGTVSFGNASGRHRRGAWRRRSRATCSSSNRLFGWHSPAQAWAMTQAQVAWSREMERKRRDACNRVSRRNSTRSWPSGSQRPPVPQAAGLPIGYIRSLEGADSLITLDPGACLA